MLPGGAFSFKSGAVCVGAETASGPLCLRWCLHSICTMNQKVTCCGSGGLGGAPSMTDGRGAGVMGAGARSAACGGV